MNKKIISLVLLGVLLIGIGCIGPFAEEEQEEENGITDEEASYNLTINTEGEGETTPESGIHTYEEGEEVTVTAEPKEDWEFNEWTGDKESTESSITIKMDENKDLTAHFTEEINYYTLTTNVEGEGDVEIDPDQDEYKEGTKVKIEAISEEDWYLDEWTGDYNSTLIETEIEMNEDKEITANFKEGKGYELKISPLQNPDFGNLNPEPGVHIYGEGTEVTLTAERGIAPEFFGWSGENREEVKDPNSTNTSIVMEDNYQIKASFGGEPVSPSKLEIKVEGEGTTEPEPGTHRYEGEHMYDDKGRMINETVKAIPEAGWKFEKWTGDQIENKTQEKINITRYGEMEITAHFKEDDSVNIYYFWGDGCPACAEQEPIMDSIEEEYGEKIQMERFEVYYSEQNSKLFQETLNAYEVPSDEAGFVPTTFIGEEYLIGVVEEELKNEIDQCLETGECESPAEEILD